MRIAANTGMLAASGAGRIELNGAEIGNIGEVSVSGSGQLLVGPDGRINNTGKLRIGAGGTVEFAQDAMNLNMVAGRLDIAHGGVLEMASGLRLSTGGSARIDNSGRIVLRGNASFENGARFAMQAGSRIELDAGGHVINGSLFDIAAGADIMGAGMFEQVAGIVTLNGTISLPLSVFSGGILQGSGAVLGNAVLGSTVNAGSVVLVGPGNSPGTLTFAGDVRVENAIFDIEAADFDRMDRVVVAGALDLVQAQARFLVGPDFQPDLNDSGAWLTAGSFNGMQNIVHQFDNLAQGWEVAYNNGNVALWNPLATRLQNQFPLQLLQIFAGQISYVDDLLYTASVPLKVGGSLAIRPGSTFATQHFLQVEAGGRLTNRGTLLADSVGLRNSGLVENRSDGVLRNTGNPLTNSGRFINTGRLENASMLVNESNGHFLQRGVLVNETFATVGNRGQFLLSGVIEQADTALVENEAGLLHIQSSGRIVGGRYSQAGSGAETRVDGALDALEVQLLSGVVSGGGRIGGPIQLSSPTPGDGLPGAVLRPGSADTAGAWGGVLGFGSGAYFGSATVVEILLTGATSFGALRFDQQAVFDPGTRLHFVFAEGFVPVTDLVVPFLQFNADVGLVGFDAVLNLGTPVLVRGGDGDSDWTGGNWRLAMHADGVDLLLAPVPEPETYALLLAGLALVGWQVRRQRRAQGPATTASSPANPG